MGHGSSCRRRCLLLPFSWVCLVALLATCASRQQMVLPEDRPEPERIVTDADRADIVLTAAMLPERQRRTLFSAPDPVAWLIDWWIERDPTPGTTRNEALDIARLRAEALSYRYPETPLTDLLEPWLTLLKFGHWDRIQNAALPVSLRYPETLRMPQGFANRSGTHVLIWDGRKPFSAALNGNWMVLPEDIPRPPSLVGAWAAVEDASAPIAERTSALLALSDYELPEVAERLLDLPASVREGIEPAWEAALERLAVRRAICLDDESVRRLAALRAIGAPASLQLERTLPEYYPPELFASDLDSLYHRRRCEILEGERGPHPSLAIAPEGFLNGLTELFPSYLNLTGWNWRGDLYLQWGPPRTWSDRSWDVLYVHGYPVAIAVRSSLLGRIDPCILFNPLEEGLRNFSSEADVATRREDIIARLAGMIPDAVRTDESLLGHLHRILPLEVRRVDSIVGANALNVLADVVAFTDPDGEFDIMVSLGIPFTDVGREQVAGGFTTRLETACLLLDEEKRTVWSEWHDEGFSINNPRGDLQTLYLVDGFRVRTVPDTSMIYCSVFDPETQKSAALLFQPRIETVSGPGPFISPIALADTVSSGTPVEDDPLQGTFTRGEYRLLPYPGRNLLYGEDIWLYFEITGLTRSEYLDYAWEESYYLIPDLPDQGIVRIPGLTQSSIQPRAQRQIMIDLSMLEHHFTGPLYIAILIRDTVSGREAVGATRFTIHQTPPPPQQHSP